MSDRRLVDTECDTCVENSGTSVKIGYLLIDEYSLLFIFQQPFYMLISFYIVGNKQR